VNRGQHRAWTQYTAEQRVESTQRVYSEGLVVVSARTNKRNKSHHHHQDVTGASLQRNNQQNPVLFSVVAAF
jgi:hypothetical protein